MPTPFNNSEIEMQSSIGSYNFQKYPFAIAYFYQKAKEKEKAKEKLHALLETYDRILMYIYSLLLASHFHSKDRNPQSEPYSFSSDWLFVVSSALKDFSSDHPLYEEIYNWYREVEENNTFYIEEVVDYKYYEKEIGHLSSLKKIQEASLTFFTALEEDEFEKYTQFCESSIDFLWRKLAFLNNYVLYWVEGSNTDTSYHARKLNGENPSFSAISIESSEPLKINRSYLYSKNDQSYLDVHPFIVYQDCYYSIKEELSETKELFLWQSLTGKRICYSGYLFKVALREHLDAYQEVVKKVENSEAMQIISTKALWEKSFHATEQVLEKLKSVDLISNYLPRRDKEVLLENFLEKEEPLIVVMGGQGVGKTVLLAQMSQRWCSRGEFVIFIRSFGDLGENLEEEIDQIIKEDNFLKEIKENEEVERCILIFDGIENVTCPSKLLHAINEIASLYQDKLKIIISMREAYQKLYHSYLCSEMYARVEGRCPVLDYSQQYIKVESFSPSRGKKLYSTISQNKVGPNASYDSFPTSIKRMLDIPAVVRIFLWSTKGRELNRNITLRDIMEGVVVNQINSSKARRQILEKFTQTTIMKKKGVITLDDIVLMDDSSLMNNILDFSKSSDIARLKKEGVLERLEYSEQDNNGLVLRIPIQLLQEYLAYRMVALAGKHGDEYLPSYFQEIQNGDNSLTGVVYFALLRLLDKHYFDRFTKVVNSVGNENIFVRQVLFDLFEFKEKTSGVTTINKMLEAILASPSQNSLLALADFAKSLYGQEKFTLAAFLFERLSPAFNEMMSDYNQLTFCLLAAHSYQKIQDDKKAHKLYKKCAKLLKKVNNPDYEIQVCSFLGKAYLKFGELDKANVLFEKCQELQGGLQDKSLEGILFEALGLLAENNQKFEEALQYYKKQQEVLDNYGNHSSAKSLEHIARILTSQNEIDEAMETLEEAIEYYEDWDDDRAVAHCQHELSSLLKKTNKDEEAIPLLLKAQDTFEALSDKETLAQVYMDLGKLYQDLGKREESKSYFLLAQKALREIDNELGLALCYQKFGEMEYSQNNFKKAIENYQWALEIYTKHNQSQEVGEIYNSLGNIYNAQSDLNRAYENYSESLRHHKQNDNIAGVGEVCNNIAVILAHSKKFSLAEEKLNECQQVYEKISDPKGMAVIQGTKALILKLQGEGSDALAAYLEAARMFEEVEEERLTAAIYNSIGLIYKERGDTYNALSYFEKSASIHKQFRNLPGLAAAYNNLGLIYDSKNDYEQALKYYSKDLEITKELGDRKGLATSYNNIAILHYNNKNYARAIWYLEKSVPLYEEIGNESMVNKIKERVQYIREKL